MQELRRKGSLRIVGGVSTAETSFDVDALVSRDVQSVVIPEIYASAAPEDSERGESPSSKNLSGVEEELRSVPLRPIPEEDRVVAPSRGKMIYLKKRA